MTTSELDSILMMMKLAGWNSHDINDDVSVGFSIAHDYVWIKFWNFGSSEKALYYNYKTKKFGLRGDPLPSELLECFDSLHIDKV